MFGWLGILAATWDQPWYVYCGCLLVYFEHTMIMVKLENK